MDLKVSKEFLVAVEHEGCVSAGLECPLCGGTGCGLCATPEQQAARQKADPDFRRWYCPHCRSECFALNGRCRGCGGYCHVYNPAIEDPKAADAANGGAS